MIYAEQNILPFQQIKENKAYLYSLEKMSFGELIDESSEIIRQLQKIGLNEGLTFKSKSLLHELGVRAGKQNHHMNSSIKTMKSVLEKKLRDMAN